MRISSFVLVAAHISLCHAQYDLEVAIETHLVIHLFFLRFLSFLGAEIQRQPINLNEPGKTNGRTIGEKLREKLTNFALRVWYFYRVVSYE